MKTQLSHTIKESYRNGGTRAALAGQLRVSPRTVRAWERGTQLPDELTFDRLVDCLGIDRHTEQYWQLKQEMEQWNAADHTRSLFLEVALFVVLVPALYFLLHKIFGALVYLPALSLETSVTLGWVALFAMLILSPALAYLLCGPLSTWIRWLFKG